jgi:hypothetical protein
MKFASQRSSDSRRGKILVGVSILLLLTGLASAQSESARTLPVIPEFAGADEVAGPSPSNSFSCLPKDVRADEAVSYGPKGKSILTVEKKLAEMKARCQRGKLLDVKDRNPPEDYQEIQKRESEELAKLKKSYTVIVFGCNPMIQ